MPNPRSDLLDQQWCATLLYHSRHCGTESTAGDSVRSHAMQHSAFIMRRMHASHVLHRCHIVRTVIREPCYLIQSTAIATIMFTHYLLQPAACIYVVEVTGTRSSHWSTVACVSGAETADSGGSMNVVLELMGPEWGHLGRGHKMFRQEKNKRTSEKLTTKTLYIHSSEESNFALNKRTP